MANKVHYFDLHRPEKISRSVFLQSHGLVSDKIALGCFYNAIVIGLIGTPKNLLLEVADDKKEAVAYHAKWLEHINSRHHQPYDLERTNILFLQSQRVAALIPGGRNAVRAGSLTRKVTAYKLLYLNA